MGNATVKLILREDKTRADGTAPVYLRATYARKTKQAATGVWVEPRAWNEEKGQVRRPHPNAKVYNAKLEDLVLKARAAALDARSAGDVLAALGAGAGSFTAFLQEDARAKRTRQRHRAARAVEATGAKLHAALGYPWPQGPLPWAALTPAALERFTRYCVAVKRNNPNTIRRDLFHLQALCKKAVRAGVLSADRNPFARFLIPKGERVNRRRLSLAELEKLRALDLEWGTPRRVVRDAFLFAVYAHGCRVSDLVRFTASHLQGLDAGGDGAPSGAAEVRLVYRTLKTGHPLSPKLPPVAVELVRPYAEAARRVPGSYLFPIMRRGDDADPVDLRHREGGATSFFNHRLKAVAEAAGIGREGMSSHVARHTYADLARRHGDLYAVSKSLGHTKLSTTQVYIADFDRDAVDGLTDSLWSGEG